MALGGRQNHTYMEERRPILITLEEAARLLSCSRRTIRRLVLGGALSEVRVTRDCPRVRLCEVEALARVPGETSEA